MIQISWKEGSVYYPPNGWYHQHFNSGRGKARHLAVRYGSWIHTLCFMLPGKRQEDGVYLTREEDGPLIDYDVEDPEIRRRYKAALKQRGMASRRPPL